MNEWLHNAFSGECGVTGSFFHVKDRISYFSALVDLSFLILPFLFLERLFNFSSSEHNNKIHKLWRLVLIGPG